MLLSLTLFVTSAVLFFLMIWAAISKPRLYPGPQARLFFTWHAVQIASIICLLFTGSSFTCLYLNIPYSYAFRFMGLWQFWLFASFASVVYIILMHTIPKLLKIPPWF